MSRQPHVLVEALTIISLAKLAADKAGLPPEDMPFIIALGIGSQAEAMHRTRSYVPLDAVMDVMVTENKATPEKMREAVAEVKTAFTKLHPGCEAIYKVFGGTKIEA